VDRNEHLTMESTMPSKSESTFVNVLETDSLTDIALIKATLDAEGIRYFIQGENMKYIRPGDQSARLMVHQEDVQKAVDLLKPLNLRYIQNIFAKHSRS
jgi:hypothetical protein